MQLTVHNIEYKDFKEFSTNIEFIVACCKVEGSELINIRLVNLDMLTRFRNSALKLLKSMKRDGVIKLFVFEDELILQEKMESVYLLNKFPNLSQIEQHSMNSVYIKL